MAAPQVEHTRAWVDDVVRSGLWTAEELLSQVAEALATDHPGLPANTSELWIAEATARWHAAARTWSGPTDHDRLTDAFTRIESLGVVVLQGCADHWAARDLLRAEPEARGIVWFTAPDVWHAIDEGMLEVNLWHADTANAAPGDVLLEEVLDAFASTGLTARFDEGRVEVSAFWRRRPN